jgi:uncharacterized oxidoreductase
MQSRGNTVLITGGTSGIGLALARRFVREHNQVIVTGRDAAKLAGLHAELPSITTICADMTDPKALLHIAQHTPHINVLVNNAAIQHNYQFIDPAPLSDLIDVELRTNLLGPIQLIALLLPTLLNQPSAAIVNVTSGLAFVPKESAPVYCGSKAGLHMFTKALRWQLEASRVKVFELIPPLTDTPMTRGRGRRKLTPDAVVDEFWRHFIHDRYDIPAGPTKYLLWLQRVFPNIADRVMRKGL